MKIQIKPILTTLLLSISLCFLWAFVGIEHQDKARQQNQFLQSWDTVASPLTELSPALLQAQEEANLQESVIRCYAPKRQKKVFTAIDYQEITPQTWRWVRLEHHKPDGSKSIISLRRPNAWFLANGATAIGKQVYLELPEMGIVGNASVLAFAPNRLDTRLWHENRNGDYIDRPITGKFEHQSPVVLWLTCPDIEPIGTTPNHPFWSEDRQAYIKASDLRIDEHLHTQHGTTEVSEKRLEQTPTTVYNLEVYQDHNYLVSSSGVLVHNSYEGKFENNPKHGKVKKGDSGKAPDNPDESLKGSFEVSDNSTRRISLDKETGEFNVFDEHTEGVFHGHSRSWSELSQKMKNVLIKNKVVNERGKILKKK